MDKNPKGKGTKSSRAADPGKPVPPPRDPTHLGSRDPAPPHDGNYGEMRLPGVRVRSEAAGFRGNHGEMTLPRIKMGEASTANTGDPVRHHTLQAETGKLEIEGHAPSVKVARPVTQQTITHITANRAVVISHITILLSLLQNGNDGPQIGANYQLSDALGLTEHPNAHELMDLIRELRDELRQVREALEKSKIDQPALKHLQNIGLKYLENLANNKVFVHTTAALWGVTLWNAFAYMGLVDPIAAAALLKDISELCGK